MSFHDNPFGIGFFDGISVSKLRCFDYLLCFVYICTLFVIYFKHFAYIYVNDHTELHVLLDDHQKNII